MVWLLLFKFACILVILYNGFDAGSKNNPDALRAWIVCAIIMIVNIIETKGTEDA